MFNISPGIERNTSIIRPTKSSMKPPKYPPIVPMNDPMSIDIVVMAIATNKDTLAP